MIKSCRQCQKKCCKTGPGPYKKLPPEEYLENFGHTDAYNTQCEALTDNGMCSIWKSPEFPIECRTYVCQSREYSQEELDTIENVIEDMECLKCERPYVLITGDGKDSDGNPWYSYECEGCGYEWTWMVDDER